MKNTNQPNQQKVQLLSQRELAEALNACPETISRWTKAKLIPVYRMGKTFVRYDLLAVLNAIEIKSKK
jgi:hypothetical protein